jgi:hypothetical protein
MILDEVADYVRVCIREFYELEAAWSKRWAGKEWIFYPVRKIVCPINVH